MAENEKEKFDDIDKLLSGLEKDFASILSGAETVSVTPTEEAVSPVSEKISVEAPIPTEIPKTPTPPQPPKEEKIPLPEEFLTGLEEAKPEEMPPVKAEETILPIEETIPPKEVKEEISERPPIFPEEKIETQPIKEAIPTTPEELKEEIPTPAPQKEKFELSEEDALKIYKKISKLSPNLKKYVKNIIINEDLPQPEMEGLLNLLLQNEPESEIKNFIEKAKNIIIEEIPAKIKPPVVKRYKPTLGEVIRHDFIPILRLAIILVGIIFLLISFVIIPIRKNIKAKSLIKEGVNLIYTDDIFNFQKAENNFNEALKLKKEFYEAYIKYGDAYKKVKKYERAENKYKTLLKINPEYLDGYFRLGDLYLETKDYDNAVLSYEKVLKFDRNNLNALDKIARVHYDTGKKEEALKIYKKMIEKDKDNIIAHYGLLSIYIWDNDLDNVEREHYQVLRIGIKKKYFDKERLNKLAAFYIDYKTDNKIKQDDLLLKAEDTLNRILKIDDKYSDAYYESARLLRKRKDYKNAINNVMKAIKIKEDDARYHNLLGELYVDINQIPLAIDEFNQSLIIDPNFKLASYNLANVNYYKLENYGEAKELYLKVAQSTNFPDMSYNLGYIYYNEGLNNDAQEWFLKAEDLMKMIAGEKNPVLKYALGNTYVKLGRYDIAISEYLDAIDYFKSKYGEYPKVNIENRRMVADMKLLSAIYNNIGVAYLNEGNEKQALIYFWKAIEAAKKLGYSNENAYARANIEFVMKKNWQNQRIGNINIGESPIKEPTLFNEIPKSLTEYEFKESPAT